MWFALLLVLLPLLLLLKKDRKFVPPSPPKLPILGNLHQLGILPHSSLRDLSSKYGPVMLLHLGRLPTVVISSAEAARMVLKNHDLNCCTRPSLVALGRLSYNYLDISFSPYGDYWRQLRKLCVVELFSVKRVQSYRFIREEEVVSLIHSISPFGSSSPVNLTEKLFSFTASIIVRMAFGKTFQQSGFNNINDRFEEMVREAMGVLGSFSASEYFPYVGWIVDRLTGLHGRIERIFHKLDGLFEQVIDDHLNPGRTRPDGHEDIVEVLLRIQKDGIEFGEAPLTKNGIKAVIMVRLFLAGVDTNAATVNWAMAELARNPRVMKKTQDEVRTFAGKNGRVTEDEIDQLQYLKMVVKETLRLHPPAALLLPRETMSYFRINGYDIHPKTLIQVNVWAICRDPRYWQNAEDFFPERFSDSSIDFRGQHFQFLPFGGGRRSCPGMNLATRIVELALANLLLCFDWKIPLGMKGKLVIDMEEAAGPSLTVSKKTALHLVPVDRRSLEDHME
ncbi:cytochrome P450 71B35-like [Durio zibethinus]|uniref:Cytochrome P450 71B35-like n=1 Tax=Durio zibethinus TaxID=66656 RepID=A0A6P6BEY2_DURZI|nr:cytochrome P450 71B35-like [Durio zibethinus]